MLYHYYDSSYPLLFVFSLAHHDIHKYWLIFRGFVGATEINRAYAEFEDLQLGKRENIHVLIKYSIFAPFPSW